MMCRIINHAWNKNITGWLLGGGLAFFVMVIHFNTYVSIDVSVHIEIVKRMLAGDVLYRDVFEVNPPMIIYLTYPAVYLASMFQFAAPTVLNIFNVALCLLSVICSWRVILKTEEYREPVFRNLFVVTLWFVLFVVPVCHINSFSEFGQKSHILMVLILPYLLLHLWDKQQRQRHRFFVVAMAVMASIGLCLKPYYFVVPFIIELSRCFQKRSLWAWVRLENMIIGTSALLFLVHMFVMHPEYIDHVVPIAKSVYPYVVDKVPYIHVAITLSIFIIIPVVFLLPYQKRSNYTDLFKLICIAFLVESIISVSNWHYVFYPLIAMGLLLSVKVIVLVCRKWVRECYLKNTKFSFPEAAPILLSILHLLVILFPLLMAWENEKKDSRLYSMFRLPELMQLADLYQKEGSLFFMSPELLPLFPAASYNEHIKWQAMSFNSMFLVDGALNYRVKNFEKTKEEIEAEIGPIERYLRENVADALVAYKPPLVVVSVARERMKRLATSAGCSIDIENDYLGFFAENEKFKALWDGYELFYQISDRKDGYIGTQSGARIYDVYIRKDLPRKVI